MNKQQLGKEPERTEEKRIRKRTNVVGSPAKEREREGERERERERETKEKGRVHALMMQRV